MSLSEIVETEFKKFEEATPDQKFEIEWSRNPGWAILSGQHTIYELDEDGNRIHRVAEIEDEWFMNHAVKIQYRKEHYPTFETHAEAIRDALKDNEDYNVRYLTEFESTTLGRELERQKETAKAG